MKNFYFDFVAIPRALRFVRGLLMLVGVLSVAAVMGYEQLTVRPQLEVLREQVKAQRDAMGAKPVVAAMRPEDVTQAWQQAQAASAQLNLPWSAFFVGLNESTAASRVALMSIEPDAQKGQVMMVAEARELDSMVKFVTALQQRPEFSSVVLQSHMINRGVPENPVRFRLSAQWRVRE